MNGSSHTTRSRIGTSRTWWKGWMQMRKFRPFVENWSNTEESNFAATFLVPKLQNCQGICHFPSIDFFCSRLALSINGKFSDAWKLFKTSRLSIFYTKEFSHFHPFYASWRLSVASFYILLCICKCKCYFLNVFIWWILQFSANWNYSREKVA